MEISWPRFAKILSSVWGVKKKEKKKKPRVQLMSTFHRVSASLPPLIRYHWLHPNVLRLDGDKGSITRRVLPTLGINYLVKRESKRVRWFERYIKQGFTRVNLEETWRTMMRIAIIVEELVHRCHDKIDIRRNYSWRSSYDRHISISKRTMRFN